MPLKRRSYTAIFKLQVIKYAAENGNRPAETKFGVSEKNLRDWRKAEAMLSSMKTKKANRGLKPRWPELEERVHQWVVEQRVAGRGLSMNRVRLRARVIAKEMNFKDFDGGPSWCYRFMHRNHLFIKARPKMCQKLPLDFQAKIDSFRAFVEKEVTTQNVLSDHIINMDEVPVTLDIPLSRTVAKKGQKSVSIVTISPEKSNFRVVLACCGDGSKLPPMVIFKRKTILKVSFPSSIVVTTNKKGWMNKDTMNVWLAKCYSKRPDGFFKTRKALLVMNSMRAHITAQSKDKIEACNSIPALIPGGLSNLLQPLDISVNQNFKAVLRQLWETWIVQGEHSFTATGRMRHATFLDVVGWIDTAWASVTTDTILSGFRKAGLIGADADGESDDQRKTCCFFFHRSWKNCLQ